MFFPAGASGDMEVVLAAGHLLIIMPFLLFRWQHLSILCLSKTKSGFNVLRWWQSFYLSL
jgi:hypothetical protein